MTIVVRDVTKGEMHAILSGSIQRCTSAASAEPLVSDRRGQSSVRGDAFLPQGSSVHLMLNVAALSKLSPEPTGGSHVTVYRPWTAMEACGRHVIVANCVVVES